MNLNNVIFLMLLIFFYSCNNNSNNQEKVKNNKADINKHLEDANSLYLKSEDLQIEDYIKRNALDVIKTGTGLRYFIYSNGSGDKVEENSIIRYHYKINLLNGWLCEESTNTGPVEIKIGSDNIISGLEEGLRLLRAGDKAKFIVPSHLAYGWIGDSKNIPTRAVLVYDVNVLQVRKLKSEF